MRILYFIFVAIVLYDLLGAALLAKCIEKLDKGSADDLLSSGVVVALWPIVIAVRCTLVLYKTIRKIAKRQKK